MNRLTKPLSEKPPTNTTSSRPSTLNGNAPPVPPKPSHLRRLTFNHGHTDLETTSTSEDGHKTAARREIMEEDTKKSATSSRGLKSGTRAGKGKERFIKRYSVLKERSTRRYGGLKSVHPRSRTVVGTVAVQDTKKSQAGTQSTQSQSDAGKGKGRAGRRYGVVKVVDPGAGATLDVLCIHGLNGDAFGTWTFEGEHGDVFWLEDCLPTHLPNARILTYGYDGETEGTRPLSHQSIQDIAETLVARLTLFRLHSSTQKRPLIFIAHSVGGIVLKHALVNSSMASMDHNWRHRSMHESTVGIIFLGTPHQGVDGAPWHAMLPSIFSVLTTEPNVRELNDLCRDSVTLQDLSNRFTAIAVRYRRTYIYETRPSRLREGGQSVIVPKASAVVHHPNAEILSRHTDHLGLAKFDSEDNDGFKDIVYILQDMVRELLQTSSRSQDLIIDMGESDARVTVTTEHSEAPFDATPAEEFANILSPHRPMSSCTLYTWHLIQKQIGFPLWHPSPYDDAPPEYRRVGVEIGDVGCIVEGTFDYHFNVCKPADHPVNRGRVPSAFTPLLLSESDIRRLSQRHQRKSQHLSSKTLWCERCVIDGREVVHNLTGDGFHYMARGNEGALLVLPKGADFQELRSLERMERYVRDQCRTWFAYMDERGIRAPDLCLVTATDKTCSWGVASVHASPDSVASFRFSCSQVNSTVEVCQWSYQHPVVARASEENSIQNQCVFLRGFNLSRRRDKAPLTEASIRVGLLDGMSQEGYYRDLDIDGAPSIDGGPTSQGEATKQVSFHPGSITHMTLDRLVQGAVESDSLRIESLMLQPETLHPCHMLNRLIMQLYGADVVEVAISHDNDWCDFQPSVLKALLDKFPSMATTSSEQLPGASDVVIEQGIAHLRGHARHEDLRHSCTELIQGSWVPSSVITTPPATSVGNMCSDEDDGSVSDYAPSLNMHPGPDRSADAKNENSRTESHDNLMVPTSSFCRAIELGRLEVPVVNLTLATPEAARNAQRDDKARAKGTTAEGPKKDLIGILATETEGAKNWPDLKQLALASWAPPASHSSSLMQSYPTTARGVNFTPQHITPSNQQLSTSYPSVAVPTWHMPSQNDPFAHPAEWVSSSLNSFSFMNNSRNYSAQPQPMAYNTPNTYHQSPLSHETTHIPVSPGSNVGSLSLLDSIPLTRANCDDSTHSAQYTFPSSASSTKPVEADQRQQVDAFESATRLPSISYTGPFVPQHVYRPQVTSDLPRYTEKIALDAPIEFWMEEPVECGILLSDALDLRVERLRHRGDPMFKGRGPSVSIRLEWPGYRHWSRQIPTKDFESSYSPTTKARVAENVAKCIQRFFQEYQSADNGSDDIWRLGSAPNQIRFEDIVLVSLVHVSVGSWQPILRLRHDIPYFTL